MSTARHGELVVGSKPVSWVRDGDRGDQPLVVLAHGAGAPYTSTFMELVAAKLVERGLGVVRFHFPYMERVVREGKRRPPNTAPILLDTWRAVLDEVTTWEDAGPVVLSGKSMGGRMASMLLAEGRAPEARGAVYLGYPLHPPGRPEKLRSAHLPDVPVPQLFIQGTKDNLCRLDLLEPVLADLGDKARLHVVQGGDHSLAVKRRDPEQGMDGWLDVLERFIREVSRD